MDDNNINSDVNLNFEKDWYVLNENDIEKTDSLNTTEGYESEPEFLIEINCGNEQNEEKNVLNKNGERVNLSETIIEENSEILQNNLQEFQEGICEVSKQLLPYEKNSEEIYKFEDNITVYEPVYDSNLDEFFFLLTTVSVGTFFLTICGLSLMFINQTSLLNKLSCDENITCVEPRYYKCTNQTHNWYNVYKLLDEEEVINKYCTNKYRKSIFKNRFKKRFDRQSQQMTRDCRQSKSKKFDNLEEQEKARKIMEDDDAQDEQFRLLQQDIENQKNAYNNIKSNFDSEKLTYFDNKNFNKTCIKLMLKEIVEMNKLKYLKMNETIDKSTMVDETIKEPPQNNTTGYSDGEDFIKQFNILNKTNFKMDGILEKDNAIQFLKDHIKQLTEENDSMTKLIKEKQKKLYLKSISLSYKSMRLEYRKQLLSVYEDRLKTLLQEQPNVKETSKLEKEENISQSGLHIVKLEKSPAIINIPLKFLHENTQKSMSQEMLDDILRNTPKNETICLCEDLEEDTNNKSDENSKKNELDNLIIKKCNTKLTKKPTCLAKWDDKTIWFSRKLNDFEHKRLQNLYPKCNPAKCWVNCKKYTY